MKSKITISFLPERDADLIKFIESKKGENISEYIRQLIRADKEGKTHQNINHEALIEEILRKIGTFNENNAKSEDIVEKSLDKEKIEDAINDLF